MSTGRRATARLGGALLACALSGIGGLPLAAAEEKPPGTYGGPDYTVDYPQPPTRSENQSKLWFAADAWWALMLEPTGRVARVFELMPDHTWRPTSAVVNTDVADLGDAVHDGDI